MRRNDFTDPIVPALAIPQQFHPDPSTADTTGEEASKRLQAAMGQGSAASRSGKEVDISDASNPIPRLSAHDLPHCPECNELLRPGVVWFGEALPTDTLATVDEWMESDSVDLILVIGTSSQVWPAAGYTHTARSLGARVAVINMDANDKCGTNLEDGDWFFRGDAATIVPEILKSVIGEI